MSRSFLASLATRRNPVLRPSGGARYDTVKDMTLVRRQGRWVDAIDAERPPKTLKADIERGEDQKLWR